MQRITRKQVELLSSAHRICRQRATVWRSQRGVARRIVDDVYCLHGKPVAFDRLRRLKDRKLVIVNTSVRLTPAGAMFVPGIVMG